MKTRKILILTILFIAVAGLTISSVDAATKNTGKMYFKKGITDKSKYLGKGDYVNIYYTPKKTPQTRANYMAIAMWSEYYDPQYYKMAKITVKFSKKVNGKTVYTTKSFKANKYNGIDYYPKNGYKPYYAVLYYKNK